ncbi:Ctr copper transporter family-domain-containing protein [Lineolata rhizophorae]|uniref:Copper transport protein n=1 Tax=Lineolata rhizophorae TaxID=578093 RepID=A0A6A6NLX0_9PEZI|nr:Ctr copper transporter family-domain-containing protein [Lineolata rhizophorae]
MGHGDMDHGGMDHGGMDMGDDHCSMNMLFTWNTKNLCIVFPQWHVRGALSLVFSLVAVALLTTGYELVRELSRRYEARCAAAVDAGRTSANTRAGQRQVKIVRAAFYAVQVFYSFFIMLLFMTYNGWVMLAVAAGAFIGFLLFGQGSSTKSVACH